MVNGSSAEVENSAAFKCLCSPGWAGPICDIYEREFCSAGVCKNGLWYFFYNSPIKLYL
jgi:hypothetical protein